MSQSAQAHFLRGMGEANAGRIVQALQAVGMAVGLADRAEYLGQYARLLVQVRRDREALQAADRAVALKPTDALTLDTIGCVYSRLGAHDRAAPLFAAAVAQQPDHVQMRYNLASSLGFLGRFEDAAQNYEALIAIDPGYTRAHFALSALKKQSCASNHIKRLAALLPKVRNSVEHLHVRYALAKECEDLADHDASFGHLEAANRPRKAELGYSIDSDRKLFARLMDQFARDDYFQGMGEGVSRDCAAGDAPIFVFGMPRTGTTLVDRIVSSHPLVESAGELQVMQIVIKRLTATPSRVALDPQTVDAAARLAPVRVGADYLEGAAPHRKTSRRFVDKLPLNFLYAGYIARALPGAKLVCLRRDPLDTVWSNYRHLFATGYSYYNYSFDLMDTARYYVLFDRLVRFWEQLFPGRILQVQYESLVHDQEAQTRRLLEHCAVPWNEACLSFHENPEAVATPSATQVRQPLYRTALGRWRLYERYLQPVREYFESEGITSPRTSYGTAARSPADG
jgi:tetratricopeptide (TPR) repeat protein